MTWGYIYIVTTRIPDDTRHKIGLTGDLQKLLDRMKRLNSLNAHEIRIILILKTRRPVSLEAELHRRYKTQHAHDEWYDLTPSDIIELKDAYKHFLYMPNRFEKYK